MGNVINIKELTKKYGKKQVLCIDQLKINKNDKVAVIGPNGSGKTTFFKVVLSLIKDQEYQVFDVTESSIGFIEQPGFYRSLSGYENLKYLLTQDELSRANELIEYFDMKKYINDCVKTYSQGMRQRLAFVIVFSKDVEVVVLDEPFNALDDKGVELLRNLIIKSNKTILVSSHEKRKIIDICNRILVLENAILTENKAITKEQYLLEFSKTENCQTAIIKLKIKQIIYVDSKTVLFNRKLTKQELKEMIDFDLVSFKRI